MAPKPAGKAAVGWKAQAEKMKQDLLKRNEEAARRQKEGTGGKRASYFIKEKVANIPFYNPGTDEHIIDVVPYKAGRQDPRVSEGEFAYVLDFWAHFNIGPNNDAIPCNKENWKKPCAVCQHIRNTRLERKDWDRIKAKRRTIYLVWPHDEKKELEKKGLHIWDVAHWYFEDKLTELAQLPRGGGYILWQLASKDGKQVRFKIKSGKYTDKTTGESGERKEFVGHSFLDRDEDLPEKIAGHTIKLDELLNLKPTVKEVEELLYGAEEEKDAPPEEETPAEEGAEEETPPEEEAPAEEEAPPEESPEEDDLVALDRLKLRMYIKENSLDVKVYKTDSDDDIRNKIREAMGTATPEEETPPEEEAPPEEEQPQGDEFTDMSRDDLRRYIVKNKLQETVKVYKTDSDDDLREKLRAAVTPEPPKATGKAAGKATGKAAAGKKGPAPECPAGGVYGKDADQHNECLECKHYKECTLESGN